jgi:serine/threonine-protein kinase
MRAETLEKKGALGRFNREARALAALRGRHVVRVLDFGTDERGAYLVMELLQGESLEARLARVKRLSQTEAAWVLSDLASGLGQAHAAGLVHRDVKPANVFLCREEDREIAKVLDFGVAKARAWDSASHSGQTSLGTLLGTPAYMSPEQANGATEIDFRSDVWSFGVLAFQCLTGMRPFDGRGLGDVLAQICAGPLPVPSEYAAVPPRFDGWFAACVQRDPAQRFASIERAAAELRECLGEPSVRRSLPELEMPAAPASVQTFVGSPSTIGGGVTASSGQAERAAEARRASGSRFGVVLASLVALAGGGSLAVYLWRAPSAVPGAEAGTSAVAPVAPSAGPVSKALPQPTMEPPRLVPPRSSGVMTHSAAPAAPSSAVSERKRSEKVRTRPAPSTLPVVPPPKPEDVKHDLKF